MGSRRHPAVWSQGELEFPHDNHGDIMDGSNFLMVFITSKTRQFSKKNGDIVDIIDGKVVELNGIFTRADPKVFRNVHPGKSSSNRFFCPSWTAKVMLEKHG